MEGIHTPLASGPLAQLEEQLTLNHLCSSAVLPLADSLAKTPQLSAVQPGP